MTSSRAYWASPLAIIDIPERIFSFGKAQHSLTSMGGTWNAVMDAMPKATRLAASHLIGVTVLCYIPRVEPIASASVEELMWWLGPVWDRYLASQSPEPKVQRACQNDAKQAPQR